MRGEPEHPVLGVFPWQAERLIESLQGSEDRVVTALPRGTNELSANLGGFTIWSQKWDLLFPTELPTPNSVLATPQHSMLWFTIILTRALALSRALPRGLDFARAFDLTRDLDLARHLDLGHGFDLNLAPPSPAPAPST